VDLQSRGIAARRFSACARLARLRPSQRASSRTSIRPAWPSVPMEPTLRHSDEYRGAHPRTPPAFGVAFNSTGTTAYITCRTHPGTVQIFDSATYKIVKTVNVGKNPSIFLLPHRVSLNRRRLARYSDDRLLNPCILAA